MDSKEAYKLVLEDLQQCNMFKGIYDTRNGNVDYMYGICSVMEWIAYKAGNEEFSDMFMKNIVESKERAK